jgi:hypothetical protein
MTHEQLLNIASVFIMEHKEDFINCYATDQSLFGKDSSEAFIEAENLYNEFTNIVVEQL